MKMISISKEVGKILNTIEDIQDIEMAINHNLELKKQVEKMEYSSLKLLLLQKIEIDGILLKFVLDLKDEQFLKEREDCDF